MMSLRERLVRESGKFGPLIKELTGKEKVKPVGKGDEYAYDMWAAALTIKLDSRSINTLRICIDYTDRAIGKLEDEIEKGVRDKETGERIEGLGKTKIVKPTGSAELSPGSLFDNLKFHPSTVEASRSCFIADNYREAILNAFIGLIDHIKELTGLDLDGDDLMNKVFSLTYDKKHRKITKYPIIRINNLKNSSNRNEQQGFMFLCKGAAGAIRNPKAHKLVTQSNPLHTLEYLAFASLLRRRIDESKVVQPDKEEHHLAHQT